MQDSHRVFEINSLILNAYITAILSVHTKMWFLPSVYLLGQLLTSNGTGVLPINPVHGTSYNILTRKTTQNPLPDDVTVPLEFYHRTYQE